MSQNNAGIRTSGKEHCMFNIKKKDNTIVTKSVTPSTSTGRQLAKVMLDNVKLQSQLEQVKSPDTISEKVSAIMEGSQNRIDAIVQASKEAAPSPKLKGSNLPNLQAACAGLGENITTFTRDPFTNEPLYGKDAKFPTLSGGYYITNDDPAEGYYLLFNGGMVFILTNGQSQGDYMSVLYRPGSGHLSQADMQSIIKAKLSLSKLKAYYRIVLPTTHVNPSQLGNEPWSPIGAKLDWVNINYITVPQLFRLYCAGAQIIW